MKKYLLLLASLAFIPFGFTACSSNDDESETDIEENENLVEMVAPQYANEAKKFEILEILPIPFEKEEVGQKEVGVMQTFELEETGEFIIRYQAVPEADPSFVAKTRAGISFGYVINTYVPIGVSTYRLNGFGTVAISNMGSYYELIFTLLNGTIVRARGRLMSTVLDSGNIVTRNLCRAWVVNKTRVKVKDSSGFYQKPGCNVNEIVNYVKQHAQINDSFEANQVVTAIKFTSFGTMAIYYANNKREIGSWNWDNITKRTFKYAWDSDEMGFSFADGTGKVIFLGAKSCCLIFNGSVKNNSGEYKDVELRMYLNEK